MSYRQLGTDLRKVGAEFIGTFALVFAGCGAIAADHLSGGAVGHVGISLTFGLVVCVMIYATGHISGAHFNPAVTVGFAVVNRFPWKEVPAYVAGQLLAAITAIALLRLVTGSTVLGQTLPSGTLPQALSIEALLTFFLMFVISAVATDHRATGQQAGVAIGGTVALCALFGGPLTGASMNPARTLGPALFGGSLDLLWLYTLGPLLGAMAGARCYEWLRCTDHPGQDARGCC
ncbi:MAG: MIP family channel protein [Myxococcota bacterium]|jgi:MIP family channel proteins|nr:MIP family channel protein [Myxococcota bacterium]